MCNIRLPVIFFERISYMANEKIVCYDRIKKIELYANAHTRNQEILRKMHCRAEDLNGYQYGCIEKHNILKVRK